MMGNRRGGGTFPSLGSSTHRSSVLVSHSPTIQELKLLYISNPMSLEPRVNVQHGNVP